MGNITEALFFTCFSKKIIKNRIFLKLFFKKVLTFEIYYDIIFKHQTMARWSSG